MSDLPFGASKKLHEQREREMGVYAAPNKDTLGVQERTRRILDGNTENLTERDLEFVKSIRAYGRESLTPKQSKWFRDCEARALSPLA